MIVPTHNDSHPLRGETVMASLIYFIAYFYLLQLL